MSKIISVSRRTDIPAFYGDWFMNRINEGFVGYVNPFGGQKYIVSLNIKDVICFVFWSKNFSPFLGKLERLEHLGYSFYFNFTITGLPRVFEPHVIDKDLAVDTLKTLGERYSRRHINWRYDPILLSNITDEAFHRRNFADLCSRLNGYVERCYISYPTLYAKVRRNFITLQQSNPISFYDPESETKQKLADDLAGIAEQHGISLFSCCNDILLNEHIQKAHCVDADLINELFDGTLNIPRKGTRKECGCSQSTDIGKYDSCPHGCVYCYANCNKSGAEMVYDRHDINAAFLGATKEQSDEWIMELKQ